MNELKMPDMGEYHSFYQEYIDQIKGLSVRECLSVQAFLLEELVKNLDEMRVDQPMADGKWTFNHVIGHILDTEKIMHYRLLAICRDPGIALNGFDQDAYVVQGRFKGIRTFHSNLHAISLHRNLLVIFMDGLEEDQSLLTGTVYGHPVSVRALYYIICGHMQHHLALLRSYLGS